MPDLDPAVFLRLVATGSADDVRQALTQSPHLVNATGPHPFWGGRPQPLHVAIEARQHDIFRLLLDAGANVNGNNAEYDYWSPIMLAIHGKDAEMRDELLKRGAHVGVPESLLLERDAMEIDHLLDHVPNGGSILNFARTTRAIDRLLELGASIDTPDRWGTTPVSAMSRLGHAGLPLLQHLVARGAIAAPENYARAGDQATLKTLLGPDPAIARRADVIFAAVEGSHHSLVRWLISQGADPNTRTTDRSRQTLLHSAAWNGDLPLAQLLVEAGADPGALDEEHHNTPQGWAETALVITKNPACQAVADYLARHSHPS